MLILYQAIRARETLENISRLTRGNGSVYYPPRLGFGPYRPRPIPEDPEPSDTVTDTEIMDELPEVAGSEIAIPDSLQEIRRWARENPLEAQIVIALAVVLTDKAVDVLIAIYL